MPIKADIREEEWIRRALKGDDDAFALVVESYQGPVFNLCYRMLGDSFEAEDAAQEIFIKAYRNLKRYDPERKFVNWILSIASNHCIDRLRKRRLKVVSMQDLLPSMHLSDPQEGPERTITLLEQKEFVQEMLEGLKPQDRVAVALRYWYDMSYVEIADNLNMTVSAVKSRLHRARNELALEWQAQECSVALEFEEAG